jgi:ribosomal-protein-alanine N-acetyltransferase
MTAMTIDPMTEEDLEAVLAIDLDSFHPAPTRHTTEQEDPRTLRARQLREELVRPFGRLRVARASESSEVLGYVLFWHVTDEIHLLNVAVDPAARRAGVGRALVEEVIAYARAHAAIKILLELRASNHPALALYRSLGFSQFNVREKYYSDNDENGIEMVLSLI